MIALLGGIGVIIGIVVSIGTIMAMVRIITNCGYSGWWVLLPFAPPLVGYVFGIFLLATLSLSGGRTTGSHILGLAVGYFVIEILSWLVSWYIFMRFAFADWPLLQQARGRRAPRPGFSSYGAPPGSFAGPPGAYPAAPPPLASGAASAPPTGSPVSAWAPPQMPAPAQAPPPEAHAAGSPPAPAPAQQSAAPGWYRSGQIGAGEQSYWDGTTWTARRKWQSNAWVDLPMAPRPDSPPEDPT